MPGCEMWIRIARDHLANERTWLAYLRTSLALASTGVGTLLYPPFVLTARDR